MAICDTTSCQVYGGRAVQPSGGAVQNLYGVAPYSATTDAAVAGHFVQESPRYGQDATSPTEVRVLCSGLSITFCGVYATPKYIRRRRSKFT